MSRRKCLSVLFLCLLLASAAFADVPTLATTGNLNDARRFHTATLLSDGTVLVVGGVGVGSAVLGSAEKYASGHFVRAGSLNTPRWGHTATRLNSGKVLLVGGSTCWPSCGASPTAELYDSSTQTSSPVGSLSFGRDGHKATLLPNGKVLIVGGGSSVVEQFDPATNAFTLAGQIAADRYGHSVTLLPNGTLLIAGGSAGSDYDRQKTAELFDPSNATSRRIGDLSDQRWEHSATLLANGKVLLAGGARTVPTSGGFTSGFVASTDIFDSATGAFTPAGTLSIARDRQAAVALKNGDVLLIGGEYYVSTGVSAQTEIVERFQASTGSVVLDSRLKSPMHLATATLLPNGSVLIAGGSRLNGTTYVAVADASIHPGSTGSSCVADATTLCLNQSRYKVQVTWGDGTRTGVGQVAPAGTADSGLFWFFNAENWELLVKVLNGCGVNQRVWVFAAATTNVEYHLVVTDTQTGVSREYVNPLGVSSAAITATDAFASCP